MFSSTEEHSTSRNGVFSTRGNKFLLLWLLFTSIDCSFQTQSTGLPKVGDYNKQNSLTMNYGSSGSAFTNFDSKSSLQLGHNRFPPKEYDEKVEEETQMMTKSNISAKSNTSNRDKRSDTMKLANNPPNRMVRNEGTLNKNFLRFGRAKLERNFLRFGRGSGLPGNFLRYGRPNGLSKNFLRFGRNQQPNKDDSSQLENKKPNDDDILGEVQPKSNHLDSDYHTDENVVDAGREQVTRYRRFMSQQPYQRANNNPNAGKRGEYPYETYHNFIRLARQSGLERLNSVIPNNYQ